MIKNSLFILIFLISSTLFAKDINDLFKEVNSLLKKTGIAPTIICPDCEEEERKLTKHPLPIGGRGNFNKKCESFIRSDGSYGTWGSIIIKYINARPDRVNRFFGAGLPGMQSTPRSCPRWGELNNEEKGLFWVWTMTSIAQVESSCNRRAVNTGPVPNASDRPRGLFQLNTLKKNRSWRGENCRFPSGAEYVYIASRSINCSLDIMDEILKGKSGEYNANGKIFPTNSYWEKLRPEHSKTGGAIGKLVRRFPLCQK